MGLFHFVGEIPPRLEHVTQKHGEGRMALRLKRDWLCQECVFWVTLRSLPDSAGWFCDSCWHFLPPLPAVTAPEQDWTKVTKVLAPPRGMFRDPSGHWGPLCLWDPRRTLEWEIQGQPSLLKAFCGLQGCGRKDLELRPSAGVSSGGALHPSLRAGHKAASRGCIYGTARSQKLRAQPMGGGHKPNNKSAYDCPDILLRVSGGT